MLVLLVLLYKILEEKCSTDVWTRTSKICFINVEKPMLVNQTFFKHLRNVGEDKHQINVRSSNVSATNISKTFIKYHVPNVCTANIFQMFSNQHWFYQHFQNIR